MANVILAHLCFRICRVSTRMNYYELLQVKPNATPQEIKQAYRRLVKKYHPDSQSDSADHELIVKLNLAYEVLKDPESRQLYDKTLQDNTVSWQKSRQQKHKQAAKQHQNTTQQRKAKQESQLRWLRQVYLPVSSLLHSILEPLEEEIEALSADVYDEELMSFFLAYLEDSTQAYEKAKNLLSSQPNPSLYANIAANLYYCLNHIHDGLEELTRFTQTYEEYYLHLGKELFNLAKEVHSQASAMAKRFL
ncbi:MAG: DnaJ domain-containing protein [Geminocystis sp.]|nr:DnaJ domain-containing protein [Geminocystis sp.]